MNNYLNKVEITERKIASWCNNSMRVYTITAKENVKVNPSNFDLGAEPQTRVILNDQWMDHSECFGATVLFNVGNVHGGSHRKFVPI